MKAGDVDEDDVEYQMRRFATWDTAVDIHDCWTIKDYVDAMVDGRFPVFETLDDVEEWVTDLQEMSEDGEPEIKDGILAHINDYFGI